MNAPELTFPSPAHAVSGGRPLQASMSHDTRFGVVVVSGRGQLLSANSRFVQLLGYPSLDEVLGKSFPDRLLKSEADWEAWARVADGAAPRDVKAELVSAAGETVRLRGRLEVASRHLASAPAVRAILVDDSPNLQELAARTARTECTLGLAAGISHDFNNLLMGLIGNLYLVSERLRDQPELYERVLKARDAAKRGGELVRKFADLSRGADASSEATVLDLGQVYQSLAPLLTAALGSRVALESKIAADLPRIFVNRAELEGVITNLVVNACDAFAGRSSGTVTVAARRRDVHAASTQAKAGRYVELIVTDDGRGIPPEILSRVFEPFFSTKERGHGSGLGLPMVRWFAERAGGHVSLKSRPGEGTMVSVLLPAHPDEAPETISQTVPLNALPGGSEPVIVLSEEDEFRWTVEPLVAALGYRTMVPGPSGLSVVTQSESAAVVVVDTQSLCGATAERFRALIQNRGRVVLVGDSPREWPGPAVSVPKPFTPRALATAIRTAIEGAVHATDQLSPFCV